MTLLVKYSLIRRAWQPSRHHLEGMQGNTAAGEFQAEAGAGHPGSSAARRSLLPSAHLSIPPALVTSDGDNTRQPWTLGIALAGGSRRSLAGSSRSQELMDKPHCSSAPRCTPAGDALDRFWDGAEYVPYGLVHPTLLASQRQVLPGSFEDCSLRNTGVFLRYLLACFKRCGIY